MSKRNATLLSLSIISKVYMHFLKGCEVPVASVPGFICDVIGLAHRSSSLEMANVG